MSYEDVRARYLAEIAPLDAAFQQSLLNIRIICRDALGGTAQRAVYENDPEEFHDLLTLFEQRGFIHYTRLSAGMGLKDHSNCSRWFKAADSGVRKTPDRFRRHFAVVALHHVLARDVERMQAGIMPIGGLSMKQHPQLEFDVPLESVLAPSFPRPASFVPDKPTI